MNRLVARVFHHPILVVGVELHDGKRLAVEAQLDIPILFTIGSGQNICHTMKNNWARRP